jgi:hypothetical protein
MDLDDVPFAKKALVLLTEPYELPVIELLASAVGRRDKQPPAPAARSF